MDPQETNTSVQQVSFAFAGNGSDGLTLWREQQREMVRRLGVELGCPLVFTVRWCSKLAFRSEVALLSMGRGSSTQLRAKMRSSASAKSPSRRSGDCRNAIRFLVEKMMCTKTSASD
jgi:hypothetical protein